MIYKIEKKQVLPISLNEAWDFFSSPKNLNEITPSGLKFKITSPLPEKIYEGLIITYKISPFPLINLEWITEISTVFEGKYFIDNQLKGPYKIWHHQHHFREVAGGTEMTDIVHYTMPFGLFGKLAHTLKIKKQLKDIFQFRQEKLNFFFESATLQNRG